MHDLRPHLELEPFVAQVARQMAEGYRLAFLEDAGAVQACAGFRFLEHLSFGRTLYVDDLVTSLSARSRGFGHELIEWLKAQARSANCAQLHLDSGGAAVCRPSLLSARADGHHRPPFCAQALSAARSRYSRDRATYFSAQTLISACSSSESCAHDLGRRAEHERTGRDLLAARDQCARADDAARADLGAIEHDRPHPDQHFIGHGCRRGGWPCGRRSRVRRQKYRNHRRDE